MLPAFPPPRQTYIRQLREGDLLHLRHDAGNRHSSIAIAVYDKSGCQVGYVPEDDSEEVFQVIKGSPYRATVRKMLPPNDQFPDTYGAVVTLSYGDVEATPAMPEHRVKKGCSTVIIAGLLLMILLAAIGALSGR